MMDAAHPGGRVWIVDVFRHHADPMGQSTASGGGWARASGSGASRTSATAASTSASASATPAALLAALGPRERGFLRDRKATGLIGDRSIREIKRSTCASRPEPRETDLSFYLLRHCLDFSEKIRQDGTDPRNKPGEGRKEGEERSGKQTGERPVSRFFRERAIFENKPGQAINPAPSINHGNYEARSSVRAASSDIHDRTHEKS